MHLPTKPISPWWTVVAGAFGTGTGAGIIVIYAFGIFANDLVTQFGWSRSIYSYAQTSFLIATGFGTIWLGILIGRHGVRIPSIAAIAVFATAIAIIAVLPPVPLLFYLIFAIIGISGSAATAMPYAIAVTGWFDRRRGLALGLVNVGAGLGAALTPQFASWLAQEFGWRTGFVATAIVYGSIALFGLIFLVREPPRALLPSTADTAAAREGPFSFVRKKSFWLIAVPMLGVSVATFGLLGSIVPLLSDRGFSASAIATALSVAGICSWLSRVAVGYTIDRVFAPYVAAVVFLMALVGVAILGTTSDMAFAVAGAGLVGFALGAEGDLITYLVSRYFSAEIYSKTLGTMWIAWAWGSGIGTYLVGAVFALTGSYTLALWTFAAALVASAVVVCLLGPYKYPPPHRVFVARTADLSRT